MQQINHNMIQRHFVSRQLQTPHGCRESRDRVRGFRGLGGGGVSLVGKYVCILVKKSYTVCVGEAMKVT